MMKPRPFGFYSIMFAIIAQLLAISPAMAKNLPLKAGAYECFTITVMTSPMPPRQRDDPVVVARRGARVPGQFDVPDVNVPQMLLAPAAFGNVILDGKGTYRMPTIGQSGKYGFNAATGRPTFTGDLGVMLRNEYNGSGTSFHIGYQGLNFECGLLRPRGSVSQAPVKPTARVATLGPALTRATALDLTGHFEGTYICRQGETAMTLDTLAKDSGNIVALMSFGGNNGMPKGSYTLVGNWNGAKFNLKSNEWVDQPAGYIMVDIEGEVNARGVSGNIQSPTCSNFSAVRIKQ
jgi:hypothetical protein